MFVKNENLKKFKVLKFEEVLLVYNLHFFFLPVQQLNPVEEQNPLQHFTKIYNAIHIILNHCNYSGNLQLL